ncbi:NAD(P)H-quinone oxidoreductase subunit I, chloroplastic [Candidatus Lokiarchaeum ossiferum]|uniref:NAD(P)H-quinone oxidoreductase subunit I, chloroplastic n=1 Tax=Candidatus Lokiarchaeum ossiferum TaxID=2951803 RepID=A0ABY6HMT8_9ARCH|nr:NAD(P)H-quinone oxidoreductase subunit I, chloroplastic [Candidatus Lokiarchaeum sp. B-35]
MNLIFDERKCTKCMQCKAICPAGVISQNEETKQPFEKYPLACVECGHCVAVCQYDAIQHKILPTEEFTLINPTNISFNDLNGFMKRRRSIRRYKKESIPKEHIITLLESVRYSPTAENAQELKYTVITNPDNLWQIKSKMAKIFNFGYSASKFFLIKALMPKRLLSSLISIMGRWNKGSENGTEDPFLRGAPCLIVIYSKKKDFLKTWDAGIATNHLMLAAQSLGLGTVCNGFFAVLANIFPSLKKKAKIPRKFKIVGALCVGYPKYDYVKTCTRKILDYNIFE